ncbi:unnamed protein product, partial [Urochloa humidicola]
RTPKSPNPTAEPGATERYAHQQIPSSPARRIPAAAMGFIMEFAENLILRMMEDPDKRDQVRREHVYKMKERCERTKAAWSLPLRPYGFWTFDRFNSQLSWDPQISQAAGRRDPYDDLITRHSGSPPSS